MSHQDRREPLPAEYQFPTHGVDCDCPPCRDRVTDRDVAGQFMSGWDAAQKVYFQTPDPVVAVSTAYGWGV